MSAYLAPLRDMQFVMHELAGLDEMAQLPGCEEVTPDLVDAILDEAGKFAGAVLAPLNKQGDTPGLQAQRPCRDDPGRLQASLPAIHRRRLDRAGLRS